MAWLRDEASCTPEKRDERREKRVKRDRPWQGADIHGRKGICSYILQSIRYVLLYVHDHDAQSGTEECSDE